jgi:hypothetical protein
MQSIVYDYHTMSRMHCVTFVLFEEHYLSEFEVNRSSQLMPSQRIRGGISVLHRDRIRYIIYRKTEKMWPADFQA